MHKTNLKFDGIYELVPAVEPDVRGFFARLYDQQTFQQLGLNTSWVQDSHSYTAKKNTVRGIHVQMPPFTEGKLLRAVRGEMLWIMIDLRKGSRTFGQWDSIVLSQQKRNSLYIPRGFGHGSRSLTDDCHVIIKTDNYYSKEHGIDMSWDDPQLNIDWRLETHPPLYHRGKNYISFAEFCKVHGGIEAFAAAGEAR